jgi:hypothetical protein
VGPATAGGLAEIAAGVLGTAATWVASTGSRAAGTEAQTPRLVGACEQRQARGFFGGALRCLACSESLSQKKTPVCASAGADRPECGICADPAYVVIPQAEKQNKTKNCC